MVGINRGNLAPVAIAGGVRLEGRVVAGPEELAGSSRFPFEERLFR